MKRFIQIFLLLGVTGIGLSACEDAFEKLPLDAPTDANFFSNEQELELALNGAYTALWFDSRSSVPTSLQMLDLRTELAMYRGNGGGYGELSRGEHGVDAQAPDDVWGHFYQGIARTNSLLDNMGRSADIVPRETMERIEAEARFLRAFCYFYLVELFGGGPGFTLAVPDGVPLLTSVPDPADAFIGRATKQAVIDQINADLDFALANDRLPVEGDKGKATQGAARMLKARVALFNEDWTTAANEANAVIQSGTYSLFPDYELLFKYDGVRSQEVILDYPLDRVIMTYETPVRIGIRNRVAGENAFTAYVPSQQLVDSYQCTDGLHIDESPLYDPANPFDNRDPRLDASIIRPQASFGGFVFESHPDSVETTFVDANGVASRVTNEDATNPFRSRTGYNWRKYLDSLDFVINKRETEINPIYFRLAEAYLMYAEARIEANEIDQTVLDAINRVRARAYGTTLGDVANYPAVTTTGQAELRRAVRYERKVELTMEGVRWFDLKRWGIAENVLNGSIIGRPLDYANSGVPEIDEDNGHNPIYASIPGPGGYLAPEIMAFNPNRDYLFPIPLAEVDANPVIAEQQNPNY